MRQSIVTIDSAAVQHNLQQVQQTAPNAKVLAMVKADAYGHGINNCLPALTDSDALGVASFSEAKQARLLGWSKPIVLIEGAFSQAEWQHSLTFECQSVLHHPPQLAWALQQPPSPASPSRTIWLKLNSGMNRLGFAPHQMVGVAQQLQQAGYRIILISHFANADVAAHPLNQQQIQRFNQVLQQLRQQVDASIQASLCNSAGLIHFPDCHFDWVRPGIMLYGSSPLPPHSSHTDALQLKPAMRFSAALMAIHPVAQGECIGYGSHYSAARPIIKGIVSVGYGDGYPRMVDAHAWVSLQQDGRRYPCPIIGRVSMDMLAIDISGVPKPRLGATVVLWGNASAGEPSVNEVAACANTLGYELLCRMTQRPTRQLV